jgi:hypothetical protein
VIENKILGEYRVQAERRALSNWEPQAKVFLPLA